MSTAVIVVGTSEVLDAAVQWAEAGLVADSFWLQAVDASRIDPDAPNALLARRLAPRQVSEPVRLAESLHDLGALDEIRVAWIRPPDEELSGALKDLESLLRALVPPDRVHWLDIVVPGARTDATVIPLPGQWVQMRVLAEDRSAPDVTDAGWDLDLDVPLHAALLALGILAGTTHRLPWGTQSAARHYEMRGFSRVVLGAADVEHYADRFIGQEVPVASAGTVGFYPTEYLEVRGADASSFITSALGFLRTQEDSTLDYQDPEPSRLQPPAKVSFWQHVLLYLRFLSFGLLLLVGRRLEPVRIAASSYDFLDSGYTVDAPAKLPDWGARIPDFDAMDSDAAQQSRAFLDDLTRELAHDPPRPSAEIWRCIGELATAVNDGGRGPTGWAPTKIHERFPVLGAADVQPTDRAAVNSEVPELDKSRNPAVAKAALTAASMPRNTPLAAPEERSMVVSTAHAIAEEGNSLDRARLGEQLADLTSPEAPPARSLLDRLAAEVAGATLRSRLDAERWTEFATGPSPEDPLDWSGATRKFRKRTMIGAIVSLLLAAAWAAATLLAEEELPTWLSELRAWVGFAVVAAVFLGFLLWSIYAFFQTYNAFLERGRRRLEVRRHWMDRARTAITQHARLSTLGPPLERWTDLLSSIYPVVHNVIPPVNRDMPADAPKGTAVAVPVFEDREITEWLREEAATVGWRSRALSRILAEGLRLTPTDAMKVALEDDGLDGGALYSLCELREDLWTRYADSLREEVSLDVAAQFVQAPDRPLRVLTPSFRRDRPPVEYLAFAQEPWPGEADDDQRWDPELDFRVYDKLGAGSTETVRLFGDVCAISVRLQFRQIEVEEAPQRPATAPSQFDPDDY